MAIFNDLEKRLTDAENAILVAQGQMKAFGFLIGELNGVVPQPEHLVSQVVYLCNSLKDNAHTIRSLYDENVRVRLSQSITENKEIKAEYSWKPQPEYKDAVCRSMFPVSPTHCERCAFFSDPSNRIYV